MFVSMTTNPDDMIHDGVGGLFCEKFPNTPCPKSRFFVPGSNVVLQDTSII